MTTAAATIALFLATTAAAPAQEGTQAPDSGVATVIEGSSPAPSPAAARPPRHSPAMFAAGVVIASVGAACFMSGLSILALSSDKGYYGSPPEDRSAQRNVGGALLIAGPVLAVPGLVLAILGGQREAAGAPPEVAGARAPRRGQTLTLVPILDTKVAGALAQLRF